MLIKVSRILLPLALAVSLYEATSRSSGILPFSNGDKILHLLAFFTLAILDDFAFPGRGFGLRKILPLVFYGILIEIIQIFLPYRSCDITDFLADCSGLVLYYLLIPVMKKIPLLRERWNN
ncbi:MAG: VanZ family protein [Chlorobiaceae bacterium]|nr:VanZ family protein [Chlorobiaceae bacterium]